MNSVADVLFKLAFVSYAGSLGNYVSQLASKKDWIRKASTLLAVIGVALHSAYLVVRWAAAGQVEVLAREATGDQLTGLERFYTYIMHPPYTNLYDALVFVAWALMVAYLIIEAKWKLRIVGGVAVAMVIVALGEASLVTENEIKPLVPALQSYWILIHVGILFISYALFSVGSVTALMFLIKSKARLSTMGAVQQYAATIILALVSGGALFTRGAFELAPSALHDGRLAAVHYFPEGSDKAMKLLVAVPGAGPLMIATLLLLVGAAAMSAVWMRLDAAGGDVAKAKDAGPLMRLPALFLEGVVKTPAAAERLARRLGLAAFVSLTVTLVVVFAQIFLKTEVSPPTSVLPLLAQGATPPFHWGIASNYGLGILALVWGSTGGYLLLSVRRDLIAEALPDPKKLDDVTYRLITVGFPLLSFGIVMGAMWAYDAWGRYWGWDPKETWALITWTVYAVYLHTRITYGWSGKRAATIAVFGFVVVVFTFMGVNLGLTGEGLHTYGSG